MGKILEVDLSNQDFQAMPLPNEKILRKYNGGFGLGLWLLYNKLPTGTDPLGTQNPLIFMTGPLTGTPAPSATNLTVVTLNSETGFTIARSHTHGYFGAYLRFAGYDGIVIEGAAPEPVYLWVNEDRVEIRDAKEIWGKDTHATEEAVKKDIGTEEASVAAIGPAGENLCHGAIIENDKNHSASHGGCGTVMGAKRLKAIAVYGQQEVPLADREKFMEAIDKWRGKLFEGAAAGVRKAGVPKGDLQRFRDGNLLVTRNFSGEQLPEFGKGMSKNEISPKPCWHCPIGCSYDVTVTSGPYEGYTATLAGGCENLEGAGSILGISEPGTVFRLTDKYDRWGFESSTLGCSMAVAFEAYERGIISEEETDGLQLKWGNAEAAEKLVEKTAHREGIGQILAKGPKRTGELLGLPEAAVHIKGAGMSLHDWRQRWGVLFGQIVGSGSGWPSPGVSHRGEPDLGYKEADDPVSPRGKAEAARKTGMLKFWCPDSLGICWFATWGVPGHTKFCAEALSAATGWDFSAEEGLKVGERVSNLERVFNIRRGLTPRDDLAVSPRLLKAPKDGVAKGKSIEPYLEGLVREYYSLMGWDERTGKPLRSKLKELGLQKVIDHIW